MTPVAHEVLYRAGKLFGALAGHGQVMVDLLTQPAERIGRDDAHPRLCGMIGAAAMPGRAQIKKGAALWHYRLHGGAMLTVGVVGSVTARYHMGGTVLSGEVRQ